MNMSMHMSLYVYQYVYVYVCVCVFAILVQLYQATNGGHVQVHPKDWFPKNSTNVMLGKVSRHPNVELLYISKIPIASSPSCSFSGHLATRSPFASPSQVLYSVLLV